MQLPGRLWEVMFIWGGTTGRFAPLPRGVSTLLRTPFCLDEYRDFHSPSPMDSIIHPEVHFLHTQLCQGSRLLGHKRRRSARHSPDAVRRSGAHAPKSFFSRLRNSVVSGSRCRRLRGEKWMSLS